MQWRKHLNRLFFDGWGYLLTNETDVNKALDKLMQILAHEGLDFSFDKIQLRDKEGNILDEE